METIQSSNSGDCQGLSISEFIAWSTTSIDSLQSAANSCGESLGPSPDFALLGDLVD